MATLPAFFSSACMYVLALSIKQSSKESECGHYGRNITWRREQDQLTHAANFLLVKFTPRPKTAINHSPTLSN